MLNLLAQKIDLFTEAEDQGLIPSGSSGPEELFGGFIVQVLNGLMVVAGLSVFIFLIWGGIEWITAGGDKTKIEAARNKMTGAVIGLIVFTAVLVIFSLIQSFTGVEIFTFN